MSSKNVIIYFVIQLSSLYLFSQNVGIGTSTPDPKAQLDVTSSSKGILIPRLTTVQRTSITNPTKGLIVYDSTLQILFYHDGINWQGLSRASNTWSVNGNGNTDPSVNFVGTTDTASLIFRTNNIRSGRIDQVRKNVILGSKAALHMPDSSYQNTVIGDSAAYALNTWMGGNTIIGSGAGAQFLDPPWWSIVIGYNSGLNNSGSWTTIVGTEAGQNNKSWGNVFIGSSAGRYNTSGYSNTFVGDNAGREDSIGGYNSFFGGFAGQSNQGSENSFFGSFAGTSNSSASRNTGIGASTLGNNTTGEENTGVGSAALHSNSTASGNTAVGVRALQLNTTGTGNTAVGRDALKMNNSGANSAVGVQALELNSAGYSNTAMGFYSLRNCTGFSNTAHGAFASERNWTGNYNTSIGMNALQLNETGNYNTAIGYGSGTNGSWNNTVSIGNYGWVNAYHNQVFLGNNYTTWIGGWQNWTNYSDERVKKNVAEDVIGLEFITRLRPVTYYLDMQAAAILTNNKDIPEYSNKHDIEQIKYTGLMAQDVEKAAMATGYDFSGLHKPNTEHDLYSLSYADFVVPLIKAVQEQQSIIEKQNQKIDILEKNILALKEQNEKILARLGK